MTTSPHSLRAIRQPDPTAKRSFVSVVKADISAHDPKRIRIPSGLAELLRLATEALGLRRPAVHISDTSM
jgi:hypothetical protein